jgi:hypothetical protein
MYPRTGTCADGGIQGEWPETGEPTGRFLCYEYQGRASIVWTHEALRIIGYLDVPGAAHDAAHAIWTTAGPIQSDADLPSTTLGGTP